MSDQARERLVVAIGVFDGVHMGHQALLRRTVEAAGREGAIAGVVTFDPPPLAVIEKGRDPFQITLLQKKKCLLMEIGIERMLLLAVSEKFLALSAEDFIEQILLEEISPAGVVVGHDFSFGAGGEGTVDLLKRAGEKTGFWVDVLAPITADGQRISSTRIRHEIQSGHLNEVSYLLGRCHTVSGRVVSGKGLGTRELVPTANLEVDPAQLLPHSGVYAVSSQIDGRNVAGVANVGSAPTLGDSHDRLIEAHWLDYQGDLRGYELEIAFDGWLRSQICFKDLKELRHAIESDIEGVRQKQYLNPDNHLASDRPI